MRKYGDFLLRVLQGFLVGGGAILPGVSGGVLCVIFGVYRPMMEVFAHPKRSLRKYLPLFFPFTIGWLLGFLSFAKVIEILFAASEIYATCLFIGLILGTTPSLYKEAGKQGRNKWSYLSLSLGFVILFGFLLWTKTGFETAIVPNIGWFFVCGLLWGLSLVVPGMTSSSILMSLNLFVPMSSGLAALDLGVIVPMLLGILLVCAATARFMQYLFEHHYSLSFHTIVGIVLASTLIIVPIKFTGLMQIIWCIAFLLVGILLAYFLDRLTIQMASKKKEP